MTNKLTLFLRHLWLDAGDTRRVLPADMLERLGKRVTASESRHSGEIRIYAEAALPLSYVRRLDAATPMAAIIRQRAMALFGKLGVWDTAHNNGVLIYLLLAEHAIEIVADRGLAQHVAPAEWQDIVARMGETFREKRFEDGLTQALEEVTAKLVAHFAVSDADGESNVNELPDAPVLG